MTPVRAVTGLIFRFLVSSFDVFCVGKSYTGIWIKNIVVKMSVTGDDMSYFKTMQRILLFKTTYWTHCESFVAEFNILLDNLDIHLILKQCKGYIFFFFKH